MQAFMQAGGESFFGTLYYLQWGVYMPHNIYNGFFTVYMPKITDKAMALFARYLKA